MNKKNNPLGRFLKEKINELGLSERELASKCGMSHSYLNQLIKGKNPSTNKVISPTIKMLEKLSIGLNISIESLQQIARGVTPISDETSLISKIEKMSSEEGILVGSNQDKIIPWTLWNEIKIAMSFMSDLNIDPSETSKDEWEAILNDFKLVLNLHKNRRKS